MTTNDENDPTGPRAAPSAPHPASRDDVLRRIAVTRQVGLRRRLFGRISGLRTARCDGAPQN
ncbi:hypothetical protein ACIPPM_05655 [Streptomyces sp. NPDC090119]|uniref:hypothetical protein n=1 Tax=Streptomyces sp. NPDC090119 TaxID=3365951 RepID=UPI0037F9143D